MNEEINASIKYLNSGAASINLNILNMRTNLSNKIELPGPIGTIDTTSRLHPHSGDIAIGAVKNDSYFGDGAFNGDGMNLSGNIYELIIYNKVHKLDDLQKVMKYFNLKWL